MTTITTRSGKGSPLTNAEVDANFTNLNDDKVEASGDSMTGNLSFGDNNKVILGSSSDLQLYHDASNSYIVDAGTGNMYISTNGNGIVMQASLSETMFAALPNGSVRLYYDNSQKLETTSTGIDVTGVIEATGYLSVEGTSGNTGVGTDRWIGGDGTAGTWFYNVPTGSNHYFAVNNTNVLGINSTGIDVTGTVTLDNTLNISGGSTTAFVQASGTLFQVGASTASDLVAYTNNVERMRIDSSGNVGIGTNSPEHALHVNGGTSNTVAQFQSTDANAYIEFLDSDAGASGVFIGGDGDDFVVLPNASEKFRVTSTGRVGIGTTLPSYVVHASTTDNTIAQFQSTDNRAAIIISDHDTDTYIGSEAGVTFISNTGGAYTSGQLVIDNVGRVGIGTIAPSATLEVASGAGNVDAGTNSPTLKITNRTNSTDWDAGDVNGTLEFYTDDTSGNAPYDTAFIQSVNEINSGTLPSGALTFGTATYNAVGGAVERMRIDSVGNVGVATDSPANLMHLEGSSAVVGATQLILEGRYNGYGAGIEFVSRTSSGGTREPMAKITADGENSWTTTASTQDAGLRFSTTQDGTLSEKVRILASGRVGIGTQSPSTILSIQDTSQTLGFAQTTDVNASPVNQDVGEFVRFASDVGASGLTFAAGDARLLTGTVNTDNTVVWRANNVGLFATDSVRFYTGGAAERMRINSAGKLLHGTTSDPSSTNVTGVFNSSGTGTYIQTSLGTTGGAIFGANSSGDLAIYTHTGAVGSETYTHRAVLTNATGRFGIGTQSPTSHLHVNSTGNTVAKISSSFSGSTTTGLYIDTVGDTSGARLLFSKSGVTRGVIGYSHGASAASESINFSTGSGLIATMKNGNLLVGKTATSLATAGIALNSNGAIYATVASERPLILNRTTSDGSIAEFRKDNATVGSIGTASGYVSIGTSDTGILFNSGSDSIRPWDTSTNAGRDAAIDLGSSGNRFKDLYLSNAAYLDKVVGHDDTNTYISFIGSDVTQFVQGGAEAMRLNSLGYLGVGLSNPGYQLHVDGTIAADDDGGTGYTHSRVILDSNGSVRGNGVFMMNAATDIEWYAGRPYNTSDSYVIGRKSTTTHTDSVADTSNAFVTVTSAGDFLVGTSTTSGVEGGTTEGTWIYYDGTILSNRSNGPAANFNRSGNDGVIARFRRAATVAGEIGYGAGALGIGSGTGNLGFFNATIVPMSNSYGGASDGVIDLGISSRRFQDIYATNSTIQTSDRNEKQDIEKLSDAEQRVAVACKGLLRKFRWKSAVEEKGDDARIHFGIIAQDLQDAFTAEGLDAGRYGMFINSTWTDEETGEERSRMGVRYSELLAFIISAI